MGEKPDRIIFRQERTPTGHIPLEWEVPDSITTNSWVHKLSVNPDKDYFVFVFFGTVEVGEPMRFFSQTNDDVHSLKKGRLCDHIGFERVVPRVLKVEASQRVVRVKNSARSSALVQWGSSGG